MRSLALALVALALGASPASAAVISIEDNFCGCDPSSGDEDTHYVVVTAQPGEHNAITVEQRPRGVLIQDVGAPLTGACRRSAIGGGRFCRGRFDGVDVSLGDGDDSLTSAVGGTIDGGPGGGPDPRGWRLLDDLRGTGRGPARRDRIRGRRRDLRRPHGRRDRPAQRNRRRRGGG